jgi:GTP cyclohydrolase I
MNSERAFLVDIGIEGVDVPIVAPSRDAASGRPTIATFSAMATVKRDYEASSIDELIQLFRDHDGTISVESLQEMVLGYRDELGGVPLRVALTYPFVIEKRAPVSGERSPVTHRCGYSVEVGPLQRFAKPLFRIDVPVLTTYPAATKETPGGLFSQESDVALRLECTRDVFPEDLAELVERHALAPKYSYMTAEDQDFIRQRAHARRISSVMMTAAIQRELEAMDEIRWFSIRCRNRGMLHAYRTFVGTQRERRPAPLDYEGVVI